MSQKNKKLVLIGACAVIAVILFFSGRQADKERGKVVLNGKTFEVEIASTYAERQKGLMWRENLGADEGMLFIFPEDGVHPFWMKNTLIPLDMIWLDSAGKIVFIKENAQPCGEKECPQINPGVPAKYVLEINAGLSAKNSLKIGGRIDIIE